MIITESVSKELSTLLYKVDKEMFDHISNTMIIENTNFLQNIYQCNKVFNTIDRLIDFSLQQDIDAILFLGDWNYLENKFEIEMESGEVIVCDGFDSFYTKMIEPHLDIIPDNDDNESFIIYDESDIVVLKELLHDYINAIDEESAFADKMDNYVKLLNPDNQIFSLISDKVIMACERLIDFLLNSKNTNDWFFYWMYECRVSSSSTRERKAVITINDEEQIYDNFNDFFDNIIRPLLVVC
jgi:hypothetical protein